MTVSQTPESQREWGGVQEGNRRETGPHRPCLVAAVCAPPTANPHSPSQVPPNSPSRAPAGQLPNAGAAERRALAISLPPCSEVLTLRFSEIRKEGLSQLRTAGDREAPGAKLWLLEFPCPHLCSLRAGPAHPGLGLSPTNPCDQ